MSIWQLSDYDVEAVVNQLKSGKTMKQVAEDLEISVEMVACAVRKAASQRRNALWSFL